MARPPCCRRVDGAPASALFEPRGGHARLLEELVLALDELEALRLADLEGLYQEEAAERMGVSRPTIGRILESARRKVAEALVRGKALRIEGGPVHPAGGRRFRCRRCDHEWPEGGEGAARRDCPRCRGDDIGACGCRRGRRECPGPCPRDRCGGAGRPRKGGIS